LAQIYLDSLDDKPTPKAIRNALKGFQTENQGLGEEEKVQILARAYEHAVERINGQKPGLKDLAKRALFWITCAKRPLATSELQHALAVEVGEPKLDEENLPQIEDVVSVCAGLVTVDEKSRIIRLVHYTTQEYFKRTRERWFPNAETDITKVCLTYLSFHAFESGFCQTDAEFEERLRVNQLYDYVAHNWGNHAREALTLCQQVVGFLESELKTEAASQALLAIKRYSGHSKYSQEVPRQMTGLHLAAFFGVYRAANILIIRGQSLDLKDSYGRTPLSYAAEKGHEAVVKLLVEKGAELEAKSYGDRTPLLWAAGNGHEAVVKLLVDGGAELEAKDKYYGRTPLLWAAEKGHKAVVKRLVEGGAELEAKDKSYGWTPLLWAAEKEHEAVIKLLLEGGAELEAKDKCGRTPLLWAAEKGHEAVAKLLVEKGAELEAKDKSYGGRTPLSYAAEKGHEAVAKLLVEKGAEVEAKDKYGRTPLLWAAENRHEAVAKLLVEKGAKLEATAYGGRTPVIRCRCHGTDRYRWRHRINPAPPVV
jgi:ankyrin repeat protein